MLAAFCTSLPVTSETKIIPISKISIAKTGHSTACKILRSPPCKSSLKKNAAIKLEPAIPADKPDATKSAGKTAVFRIGNLTKTEIKNPV